MPAVRPSAPERRTAIGALAHVAAHNQLTYARHSAHASLALRPSQARGVAKTTGLALQAPASAKAG